MCSPTNEIYTAQNLWSTIIWPEEATTSCGWNFAFVMLFCSISQSMVNWRVGLVVWIFGIPLWKGLLLSDTPGIPYHQSKPPIYLWLNLREKTRTPVFTTIWMFPKIVGVPPKSSILIGAFYYKPSILGETPLFLDLHPYNGARLICQRNCRYTSPWRKQLVRWSLAKARDNI